MRHTAGPGLTPKILLLNYFQANPFILLFDRRTLARVDLRVGGSPSFRRPVASQAYFLPIYRSLGRPGPHNRGGVLPSQQPG